MHEQALKLISLCGWEPRVMPYVVDCEMHLSNPTAEDANVLNSSKVLHEREKSIVCIPAPDLSTMKEANRNFGVSSESVADPKSVVLDCKLCGASVGLWAFCTVPQPLEVFRLIGFTGINNEEICGQDTVSGNDSNRISTLEPNAPSSNLNLTIAGGPPPTQQNFKAMISFPVIGRSIRTHFSSDPDLRNCLLVSQENNQPELSTPVSPREEESNKVNGDTGGSQPPSMNDSPAVGSDKHGKDDGNSMQLEGIEGTSTNPNNISEEVSSQSDAGLCQNDARGHLGDSNGKTLSIAVASDQTEERNTLEVVVGCSHDSSSQKNATEKCPVIHGMTSAMLY